VDRAGEEIRAEGAKPTVELSTLVAKILRRQRHSSHVEVQPEPTPAPAPSSPMKTERKEALRRAQAKLVQGHCYRTGADYAIVNAELNKAVGVQKIRECDEEQLQKRYQLAKEWLGE
jgi:hypothetical protein